MPLEGKRATPGAGAAKAQLHQVKQAGTQGAHALSPPKGDVIIGQLPSPLDRIPDLEKGSSEKVRAFETYLERECLPKARQMLCDQREAAEEMRKVKLF